MPDHLLLMMDAPLLSLGGETIDNIGVVRDFPARSMLAGLIGNALGYERHEAARLDALQARLVFASARLRGTRITDYQTARLFEKDAGWTTRGAPEGRAKSPSFSWDDAYETARGERLKSLTHQRYRDADADALILVALRLEPANNDPDLGAVRGALDYPARPLFLGRKPNLPSRPLAAGSVVAADPVEALAHALTKHPTLASGSAAIQWGAGWLANDATFAPGQHVTRADHALRVMRRLRVCDERNHVSGVHAGQRTVIEATLEGWAANTGEAS